MQSWSVGILCYNEAETIGPIVMQTREVLQKMTDTYEIFIIDDCSSDGSREIALGLQEQYPEVKVIRHEVNKGIGMAIRSAYGAFQNENVTVYAGDGQFDVTEFLPFPEIPEGRFLSFYRVENTTYSLFRNILSYFNKKLNKVFIGINLKDVNWAKAYKKADLDMLNLELTSSLIESEVCAKLIYLGRKVIEVESKYLPRVYGESKGGSFATVKQAIRDIWKLIHIMRKFRADRKKITGKNSNK